jgi:hypothetical protein
MLNDITWTTNAAPLLLAPPGFGHENRRYKAHPAVYAIPIRDWAMQHNKSCRGQDMAIVRSGHVSPMRAGGRRKHA